MTERERRKRNKLYMTLEAGDEQVKYLTLQLRDIGLGTLGYGPSGRRLMAHLCNALKDIMDEMELAQNLLND